jgi:YD repeat-containing protein
MLTRTVGTTTTYTQRWDAENRLVGVTVQTLTSTHVLTYTYPRRARGSPPCSDNRDGNRVAKTDAGGTTHCVGGIYETRGTTDKVLLLGFTAHRDAR